MHKLNSHFRIQKQTKRYLAAIPDAHLRGEVRRAFCQAQYAATLKRERTRDTDIPKRDAVSGMLVTE